MDLKVGLFIYLVDYMKTEKSASKQSQKAPYIHR